MSTIAEHLAELEMLDANRTESISNAMVQAGYMFLIVHYAEMIQEHDPEEMAQARATVEQRLREQHPAKAGEHIAAWMAARPALRPVATPAVSEPMEVPADILEIIENLHTQDNRITQDPLFAVQQKRRFYGVEPEYRDGVVWVDDEGNESSDAGAFKKGARKLGYRDVWEFVTGGFTEQGCKDYIARDGHNLKEPRIYAYGSYRNAEFIAIRKWLMSLRRARILARDSASGVAATSEGAES